MLKILLIDDDVEEHELFSFALDKLKADAELVCAQHCVDVSDLVKKEDPDIVFMDINMPFINGLNCLKSLRAERKYEELPVVMYSTSSNPDDIRQSFEHKASMYVVKPSDFRSLTRSLEKVLAIDWQLLPEIPKEKFLIA